jgi:membrane dipeptidase
MTPLRGPWIDVHAHPGRCFLAGAPPGDRFAAALGGDASAPALEAARAAGLTAVSFATVADLLVLAPKPDGGLHAGRPFRDGEAHTDHQRQLAGLRALAERAGATVAMTAADLERAHVGGETAVLLTCEGGDFLDGRLERLDEAHAQGMSSLTLVHYRVNELGDIQTEAPEHHGLTAFGRDVVAGCNRLGIVIDCAHATFETTLGVLDASDAPVMVSHSHLDHPDRSHPRLLSDDHARAVADAGGLIGAWPAGFTSETPDDFVDEILRLVELIGVAHVAIGTDLDANYKPVLTEHGEFAGLATSLEARGLTRAETDQVLGGNALELYRAVAG